MTTQLEQAWEIAKQRYASVGVDVEEALRQLDRAGGKLLRGPRLQQRNRR